MNRAQLSQHESYLQQLSSSVSSAGLISWDDGVRGDGVCDDGACHRFFGPLHYEPNYAYPLIVWLHGSGDNEDQLKRIIPLISMRNYAAAAPRATVVIDEDDPERSGYCWSQSEDHIVLAEQRIFDCIEAAQRRYHVAANRIFLAGVDSGGTMALRTAMNHPHRFAGVLSLGGAFPVGHAPLCRLTDSRRVPLFLAVGRDSKRYPSREVCENLRLFYTAGMEVTLRQYPLGDQVTAQMFEDMDRWIMERVCDSTSTSGDLAPSS